MATLESVFKSEFKKVTQALYTNKSVFDLPNPLLGALGVAKAKAYTVKGISDAQESEKATGSNVAFLEQFKILDDLVVVDAGNLKPERTVRDRVYKPVLDINGEVVKETPNTPNGSVWVRSKTRVQIPNTEENNGFDHADFWSEAPDGYRYIYCIPKKFLFRKNMCALAVSTTKLKAYKGFAFNTWRHGKITLAVIPYNPNQKYRNTVILGTKSSDDFEKEIHYYVQALIAQGVIPDPAYFQVDGGHQNLVTQEIDPAYEAWEGQSEISLEEEGALSYAKAASMGSSEDPVVEWE